MPTALIKQVLSNLLQRHLLRAATSLDRQNYLPRAVTLTIENNLQGTIPLEQPKFM